MRIVVGVLMALGMVITVAAQTAPPKVESLFDDGPLAGFTDDEKAQFAAAGKTFNAQHYAEALVVYKGLAKAHPENTLVAKFAAEAAIDVKEYPYALETLKPIEATHLKDWQATALLTRAYAETGDKAGRDREMGRLAELYKADVVPKNVTQYIVERDVVGDKSILIFNSFEPWGRYKVCNYARIFGADGALQLRITLETSDFDQPLYVKEHPEDAAAGGRRYSVDGYRSEGTNANGQRTEMHMTFGFIDNKRPAYDEVREKFLAIAAGKNGPVSTRSGIPAQ